MCVSTPMWYLVTSSFSSWILSLSKMLFLWATSLFAIRYTFSNIWATWSLNLSSKVLLSPFWKMKKLIKNRWMKSGKIELTFRKVKSPFATMSNIFRNPASLILSLIWRFDIVAFTIGSRWHLALYANCCRCSEFCCFNCNEQEIGVIYMCSLCCTPVAKDGNFLWGLTQWNI